MLPSMVTFIAPADFLNTTAVLQLMDNMSVQSGLPGCSGSEIAVHRLSWPWSVPKFEVRHRLPGFAPA